MTMIYLQNMRSSSQCSVAKVSRLLRKDVISSHLAAGIQSSIDVKMREFCIVIRYAKIRSPHVPEVVI